MLNTEHIVVILVFIVAALLHGISGLGITMVTTTALASMYPLPYAITLIIFPSLVLNLFTWLIGGGRSIVGNFTYYLKEYWLLAVTSLIGSFIGVRLLILLDSRYLLACLAVVIGFYVISNVLGKKIILPNNKPALILTGLVAGVVGGATNAMSTILLMYLLSASDDKNTIAKVGNLCYFLSKLAQIILLRDTLKALPTSDWMLIAILTVASLLTLLIGIRLRRYLSQARFRQLVLGVLAILGLRIVWQLIVGFTV